MSNADGCPVAAHVDPADKEFMINPFATWDDLRRRAPVARSDAHGGFWVVTGFDEVYQVLHDAETFCSGQGIVYPRNPEMPLIPLIESDPPVHRELKMLTTAVLTPKNAEAMEPRVREIVTDLIDEFVEKGAGDLVEDLSGPLARAVLVDILGVPAQDTATIQDLSHQAFRGLSADPVRAREAAMELNAYLQRLVERRRDMPPQEDLIGSLLEGEVEGEHLTDLEIARLLLVVFGGGLNTVKSQLGGTYLYLAEHPDQRELLRKQPELIPAAVEEFLRYVTPIQGPFRTATRDVTLGGHLVKAGDRLFVLLASANRDDARFPDSGTCRFDREHNRHLAFGTGIHRCVGSHIARVEVQVALEEVLNRLPDYQLAPGGRVRWDVGTLSRGPDSVPVVFTPGPKLGEPVTEPNAELLTPGA